MKWKVNTLLAAFALLFLFTCQNNTSSSAGEASAPEVPALSGEEQEAYLGKGATITGATFMALSGQLKSALQKEGVAGAVQYCNLVAYPLVDSLSKEYNASIRRTSLKVRNPADEPTPAERAVLEAYHTGMENGQAPAPRATAIDSTTVAYYAPIFLQEACLKCHGKLGETLNEEDYAVIKELYPKDEAIGYQAGGLRGMWSVTFRR